MTDKSSIPDLRRQHGISQRVLAGLAGISQNTLSKIERKKVDPKLSQMIKIAEALGYQLNINLLEKKGE